MSSKAARGTVKSVIIGTNHHYSHDSSDPSSTTLHQPHHIKENIMGNLMQSLGLGGVSANVNEVPDGKYDAVVSKSEAFFNEGKDNVSHVITYQIDSNDPATKGKNKQEFFTLGTSPRTETGAFAKSEAELKSYTNTQTEMQKQFHKKRFVDLLSTNDKADKERIEAAVDAGQVDFNSLVGAKCTITIKTKDGYQNVSAAYKRDDSAGSVPVTQAVTLGGTQPTSDAGIVAQPPVSTDAQPLNQPAPISAIAGGLQ